MTQKTSIKGMMDIIAHEAVVLSRYRDVKGIWTIGIGHTKSAGGLNPETFTGSLTLEQALDLFRDDLARFEARVRKAFPRGLKQHEFDAAVSFDFNTGAIDRATWVETFNAGDRARAIEQIMNWSKPVQIIGRRRKEQALFASGAYSSDGTTMVYPATKAGVVRWKAGRRLPLEPALRHLRDAALTGASAETARTSVIEHGREPQAPWWRRLIDAILRRMG
jgi:lysozyme